MTDSMLEAVRRHCSTVPDFCTTTIIDEVTAALRNPSDSIQLDEKSAHTLLATNFLVQDRIFTPDIVYCFIPFLARQICGMDTDGVVEKPDSKPVFIFAEDHMISIRQGFIVSGPRANDNIVRRSMAGIVPEDEKINPLRTIAFNLSRAAFFCLNNNPPSQGPNHGSPRSPGEA